MNPLEALGAHLSDHLSDDEKKGSRSAILVAQIALFAATIFVWNTKLCTEHDRTGFKTALSYQIIAILVSNSRRLNGLRFIRRPCGSKVNLIANLICLILTPVLEKFYEKSLSSLGFALSITVLFLILLVIIRPSTDLGLFGFLIGVVGSVAYDRFGLKFQTWIVLAICFLLLCFRLWLESKWLQKEDPPTGGSTEGGKQMSKLETIEVLTVGAFHLFWVNNLFRTNCRSCTSSSIIMGMSVCLLIFYLWFAVALITLVCFRSQTDSETLPAVRDQAYKEGGTERSGGATTKSGGAGASAISRDPSSGAGASHTGSITEDSVRKRSARGNINS